jgi:tetratricopeptide (TPR) repeat protein
MSDELTPLGGWLHQAERFVRRFVVLSDDQGCATALWTAHTHAIEAAVVTAYLLVTSPEKRSGKTRLLEVLNLLAANTWLTGGTTKAALVRKVDRDAPTLLLDESDAAFNGDKEYSEALRGVLNNGFSRGKPFTTCIGNSHEVHDFNVAEEVMERSAELGSGAQGLDTTYYYAVNLMTWALRREQGRLTDVEAPLERYVDEYPGAFVHRCVLASVYTELGRERQARDQLDRIAAEHFADLQLESEWFLGASVLAEVYAPLGDAERAESLYEALLPYASYNVFAMPEVALGSASRPLGILATTMSRWEDAERHFEQALEMNARMGTRPWVAHSQHDYARMLVHRGASGDETRAQELLRGACGGYEALGMASWLSRANADLASL